MILLFSHADRFTASHHRRVIKSSQNLQSEQARSVTQRFRVLFADRRLHVHVRTRPFQNESAPSTSAAGAAQSDHFVLMLVSLGNIVAAQAVSSQLEPDLLSWIDARKSGVPAPIYGCALTNPILAPWVSPLHFGTPTHPYTSASEFPKEPHVQRSQAALNSNAPWPCRRSPRPLSCHVQRPPSLPT